MCAYDAEDVIEYSTVVHCCCYEHYAPHNCIKEFYIPPTYLFTFCFDYSAVGVHMSCTSMCGVRAMSVTLERVR